MLRTDYDYDASAVERIFDPEVVRHIETQSRLPDEDLLDVVKSSVGLRIGKTSLALIESAGFASVPVDRILGFDDQEALGVAQAFVLGGICLADAICAKSWQTLRQTDRYVIKTYGHNPDIDRAENDFSTREEYAEACYSNGNRIVRIATTALAMVPGLEEPMQDTEDRLVPQVVNRAFFRAGAGVLVHLVMQADLDSLQQAASVGDGLDWDKALISMLGANTEPDA